jgi:hypothetical protein
MIKIQRYVQLNKEKPSVENNETLNIDVGQKKTTILFRNVSERTHKFLHKEAIIDNLCVCVCVSAWVRVLLKAKNEFFLYKDPVCTAQ